MDRPNIQDLDNHNCSKICLHLTVTIDERFREYEQNISDFKDFNKRAKQLMDDGKQKKHFSSKIQKVCSLPILAQNVPNLAQVFPSTSCLIIGWLQQSDQLKEPH